jgi:hypothetical protein
MSLGHGSKIVTKGLVFAYDMNWNENFISKSYKGKPITNYAWSQHARIDSSYSSYVNTTSGTWPAKHPDAITVYNNAGSNISNYVNSGVTDYTNTYHAIWVYDDELKRPVIVMRNYDNNWKAKSFSLGKTYANMGLTNGDTYTISWLQWTDNTSRSANAGIYGTNTSGSANFHDGLSNSYATSYNTKTGVWQRVYATFTISASNNTATNRSCYMYGHYNGYGIIKIADVQIEPGGPSGFIAENSEANSTRSTSDVLIDWTGNNTITATSLTYNSDGTFTLNSSNPDYLDLGSDQVIKTSGGWTVETWVKYDTVPGGYDNVNSPGNFIGSDTISYNSWYWSVFNSKLALWNLSPGIWKYGSTTLQANTWYNAVLVSDPSGTSYQMYLNGVAEGGDHTTYSWNASYSGLRVRYIGRGNSTNTRRLNGMVPSTKIYNRALTADEIAQNFNALRGRYGI